MSENIFVHCMNVKLFMYLHIYIYVYVDTNLELSALKLLELEKMRYEKIITFSYDNYV